MPNGHYAAYPYDAVLDAGGNQRRVSTYVSFFDTDKALVSLAVVDEKFAAVGSKVTLLWGEPRGGPYRPLVEPHV
ncbi:glycine cleavage T protein (aminomethyl transfer ase) [Novosphingobium sp. PY1]|nr:glycine cleavage T protein [Novosphingobium sp. PY1]GFM31256.1 glycine cleavage T protein (aminomethyl transfer ase) [Novosphingobium sp. PY1]